MSHFLLALYLLTGLFGRSGAVLCIEENATLNWEGFLESCCEEREDAHEDLAHETEAANTLCPGECPCVDLPASLLLQQRLDGSATAPNLPARLPCVLPPTADAPRAACGADLILSQVADRGRPDLPGAGASPLILRT